MLLRGTTIYYEILQVVLRDTTRYYEWYYEALRRTTRHYERSCKILRVVPQDITIYRGTARTMR